MKRRDEPPLRVGVVGFEGYAGAELVGLLSAHGDVEPVLFERDLGKGSAPSRGRRQHSVKARRAARRALADPFAATDRLERRVWTAESLRSADLALVFLATPTESSLELAPAALDADVRVIDLSGAFRLASAASHETWYGAPHPRPDLLAAAVYGLPELHRQAIPDSLLVANPGCYATAASLALQPAAAAGVIDRRAGVVCDAKSGLTGAGKKPSPYTHFCSVAENVSAYGFFQHRHVPEILAATGLEERELSFVTQLVPLRRGLQTAIYFRLEPRLGWPELAAIYDRAYGQEPFVRCYPQGSFPNLTQTAGTNRCALGFEVDEATGRALVLATLDNLIKGAAGQAVQNMNLMLGRPETRGLAG